MPVGSLLPSLIESGQVPEDILRQMEAARDPAMGFSQPQGGGFVQRGNEQPMFVPPAPQPQQVDPTTAPRMSRFEEFEPGPVNPTYADLFAENPQMGQQYLQSKGFPRGIPMERIPLQGEDLKRFRRAEERRFEYFKGGRALRKDELAHEREDRMARQAEARAREAQTRLDLQERKETRELREAAEKRQASRTSALRRVDIVLPFVEQGMEQTGYLTAGFGGALLGMIPGTEARDLERTLDTIKAQIGFDELQRMREASPTGGALGQIAVRELDFLQAALASLDRDQSPSQLRENLQRVQEHFQNWREAITRAQQEEPQPAVGVPRVRAEREAAAAPAPAGPFDDPEKERRYQEWKRRQGGG